MPSFVIVEKNGSVKCTTSKTLNVSELYKKCGFKSNEGFNCAHTWSITFNDVEYKLQVYGKITGRAGSENKYEFPPPIDNVLFFGSCAVINTQNDNIVDMNATEFKDIMDFLQGGYSDLGEEDSEDEEEDDEDPLIEKTKEGYVKDDFVVDDDEDEDVDETSSEEPVPKKKVAKSSKAKVIVKKVPAKPKPKVQPPVEKMVIQEFLECSEELVEEDYV
jgi:hypothetical protein